MFKLATPEPTPSPPLVSRCCHPPLYFPHAVPVTFGALIAAYHEVVSFLRSYHGFAVILFFLYSAGTFLAITAPAWLLSCFDSKKKFSISTGSLGAGVNVETPDRLIQGPMVGDGEVARHCDAAYADEFTIDDAEDIQFHDALSSFCLEEMAPSPSSSIQGPVSQMVLEIKTEASLVSFCNICLEYKENWQMFTNDKCSHSFCYECTSSHIVAKIQDKAKEIPCPALNCKAALNFDACRLMIPDDTLVQWDELLCMSLIPESQKLYCPFRDCSTMLVNDSAQIIRDMEIICVVCKRSFCAECNSPWHPEFTCKEFQKLYTKRGGKGDMIVKTLAKKKKWQKCPKCKMYIEKAEGCVHITCRCRYEFCYRCGSKWSDTHGNCKPKS